VCDVVKIVKDSQYSSAKRKGININFIEKQLPNVLADRAAVERIMTNLLDNAIKYTKANDEGEVEIEVKKEKKFIKVLVKDLGVGIQSSDQELVFKRFYRTPDARASQKTGSGLGLAIVKNLTISLGGQVGVMKNMHKGSTFWFTLPIYNS
jgi:two-component system phosphate regulon sensor histidine kinase PhoR